MSRMTVELSDEVEKRLTEIANRRGITKAEALRRAFALLQVADEEEREHGHRLALVDKNFKPVARLVGVL